MAKNLDERVLIQMFYDLKMPSEESARQSEHKMVGLMRGKNTGAVIVRQTYRRLVEDWVLESHTRFEETEVARCKLHLYNGVKCFYSDLNDPDKMLEVIARATTNWKHSSSGTRHDFVTYTAEGGQEQGLAGIEIGRLLAILTIEIEEVSMPVVIVRKCERVHNVLLLPCYAYTADNEVIPVSRLERSVHMVPRWEKAADKPLNEPGIPSDVYDQHESFVFNTHSDNAAWGIYNDHQ